MVEVVKRQLWFYEIINDRLRKYFFQFYFAIFIFSLSTTNGIRLTVAEEML